MRVVRQRPWAVAVAFAPVLSCLAGIWVSYVLYPVLQLGEPFLPFAIRHDLLVPLHPMFIATWLAIAGIAAAVLIMRRIDEPGERRSNWVTAGDSMIGAGILLLLVHPGAAFFATSATEVVALTNEDAVGVVLSILVFAFALVGGGIVMLIIGRATNAVRMRRAERQHFQGAG